MHFFIDMVRSIIPPGWRENGSGWISGNCPACVANGESRPDRKRRGGFKMESDRWVYNCFNCNFKAGWNTGSTLTANAKNLLGHFGMPEREVQAIALRLSKEKDDSIWTLQGQRKAHAETYRPDWPTVSLPKSSRSSPLPDAAVAMIKERGLDFWTDWMHAPDDLVYKKRLLLPFRYKNKIVGYKARWLGENPENKIAAYLTSAPPHFVFNLDRQKKERNTVIVVEGEYDAISVDGVSLGTNSLSMNQAALINRLRKRVILLPDADEAGRNLIEPAIEHDWLVSFPEWMEKHKDANSAIQEYGRLFVLKSILKSAIRNDTMIRIMAMKYLRN